MQTWFSVHFLVYSNICCTLLYAYVLGIRPVDQLHSWQKGPNPHILWRPPYIYVLCPGGSSFKWYNAPNFDSQRLRIYHNEIKNKQPMKVPWKFFPENIVQKVIMKIWSKSLKIIREGVQVYKLTEQGNRSQRRIQNPVKHLRKGFWWK